MGLSGLFWSVLKGRPILTEELARDNDNAYSKLRFEIADRQYTVRRIVGQVLRYPLRIFTKSDPVSIFLVVCIVVGTLILRRIVRDVKYAWDGVEV